MKKFSLVLCLVLCSVMVFSSACTKEPEEPPTPTEYVLTGDNLQVEKDVDDNYRTYYEIFTGSFSDSNGDGIGDLKGIKNRLDYLNDGNPNSGLSLGIEGIWLTPIFKSSTYHKYDVTDYYQIDPSFGTKDDLVDLLAECHKRNIQVIIDLPINHTSTNCQWFKEFTNAHKNDNTESEYYNFYSYYAKGATKPNNNTYRELTGANLFYECNFDGGMPELNFDNDKVREEVVNIAKYYLDLGVDGFRFDAAKYIYFNNNTKSVEFWDWYMTELRKIKSDVYTVYEVWDGDTVTYPYFSSGNCFNFTGQGSSSPIVDAAKKGNVNNLTKYINSYITQIKKKNENAMPILFLSNHDTDRSIGFLYGEGIKEMAANLYLLSSGSPFIYYGEEVGLRGSRSGEPTDANRRLAMRWGDDDTIKNPEGSTYPDASQTSPTVAEQILDENSQYNYYKKLIQIRKANPEIARGTYKNLVFPSKLGGFTAEYNGSVVCVLHNTSGSSITVDLSTVTDKKFTVIRAAIGYNDNEVTLDGDTITIPSQTSVVLK